MDMSKRTVEETLARAEKEVNEMRIRQLSALRIYHSNQIEEIDHELKILLKNDVSSITY